MLVLLVQIYEIFAYKSVYRADNTHSDKSSYNIAEIDPVCIFEPTGTSLARTLLW